MFAAMSGHGPIVTSLLEVQIERGRIGKGKHGCSDVSHPEPRARFGSLKNETNMKPLLFGRGVNHFLRLLLTDTAVPGAGGPGHSTSAGPMPGLAWLRGPRLTLWAV